MGLSDPTFHSLLPARQILPNAPLVLYALVTAYIDGCTVVELVPHRFNPGEGIYLLPFFGPIHLLGAAAITWLSRFIFRRLKIEATSEAIGKESWHSVGSVFAFLAILGAAAAFPSVFRQIAVAMDFHNGVACADALWADHSAYILSDNAMEPRSVGNYDLIHYFDPVFGLPLRQSFRHEYEPGYNARLQELLAIHGAPSWSHKRQLVSDADLLAMLKPKKLEPVTHYPFDLSAHVTLWHGGTLSRWGVTSGSAQNTLGIETEFGSSWGGNYSGDAAIGRQSKYPGVIFVGAGDEWIAAVSEEGWILNAAMKEH